MKFNNLHGTNSLHKFILFKQNDSSENGMANFIELKILKNLP